MKKNLLTVALLFGTLVFNGCSTLTPAVSINKQFEQPKSIKVLSSSILEAAKKEKWEVYTPHTLAKEHTFYLRKVVKKRRGYTPKPALRKKMINTYLHVAVTYTEKHFDIEITDKNAAQLKEHHVNNLTNNQLLQLKDAIYLALAHRLL